MNEHTPFSYSFIKSSGLNAHAAGGAERRQNRRDNRCQYLQRPLDNFLLLHVFF